ncbi:hypothetical protein AM588_10007248 [Phytophthora nicotianae]|uniref:FAR1 domain-containing protein n=1 Tax=Phytophthora nicotianae TaxID=4792 RepID=A0A0W8D8J3_PHYNI|nr:hypothetical protein AM588_10007248 [Phytophthora nicotianae]
MADQAREEEEARTAEAVRRASVEASRTRAQKSRAMKIGREEKEGVDVSTESGPNEATTADATTDIQHSDDGDEHEDEEDSASASEEEKDAVVHSDTRGKKKRPASDGGDDDDGEVDGVTVPSFQTDHKTWALFEESLQEYMRTTKQVLVVSETVSTKRRNQDLRKQTRYQGLPDSQIPLVPEEMNPFQRRYICTHGWAERERSKGKRKVYKLRRTDCPFQFLAQMVRTKGQWGISLKREVYRHNHPISSDIYMSYPGIRQVSSRSPLMPGIELLVESDAKNSSIYDYIRRNSDHRVTMDDVRNLVARVRQSGKVNIVCSTGS